MTLKLPQPKAATELSQKMRLLFLEREIPELFILLIYLIVCQGKKHFKNNDGKFSDIFVTKSKENKDPFF